MFTLHTLFFTLVLSFFAIVALALNEGWSDTTLSSALNQYLLRLIFTSATFLDVKVHKTLFLDQMFEQVAETLFNVLWWTWL